jgi:hypothetical protein
MWRFPRNIDQAWLVILRRTQEEFHLGDGRRIDFHQVL